MAWRFLAHLSERDILDYLLYQLPDKTALKALQPGNTSQRCAEDSPLLRPDQDRSAQRSKDTRNRPDVLEGAGIGFTDEDEDPTLPFVGRNALEIAAIADAKKFLSQKTVQTLVDAIWVGDIIFWDSLSVKTKRKAQKYNKRRVLFPYSTETVSA